MVGPIVHGPSQEWLLSVEPAGSVARAEVGYRRILPVRASAGGGRLTLMSEVKGRGSDLAFRLTAGRFLVIVIGCTGSEMER